MAGPVLKVAITWSLLGNRMPTQDDLLESARAINQKDGLTVLIRFLRMRDRSYGGNDTELNELVTGLLSGKIGAQVRGRMTNPQFVFINRWQLLFGIKLLLVFGAEPQVVRGGTVSLDDLTRLLLQINDFIDDGFHSQQRGVEDAEAAVDRTMLQEHFLFADEQPQNLVGRYYNLLVERADSKRKAQFDNWVDVQAETEAAIHTSLTAFAALLFAIYSGIPLTLEARRDGAVARILPKQADGDSEQAHPFCLDPSLRFRSVALDQQTIESALSAISCTPQNVREEHLNRYGASLGQVFDFRLLLRRPALLMSPSCLAGLSHSLVIQRLSQGLFWDIHDHLPAQGPSPNRNTFNSFWGRLIEQYGTDLLFRVQEQDRRARLIREGDYRVDNEKTADAIFVETRGTAQRATLVEFTVGRPRLTETIISGDLGAFKSDLLKKLGAALDQELDLLHRLLSGRRIISGIDPGRIKHWFLCLVVSDPFPAYERLLKPLIDKVRAVSVPKVTVHGPFVLSMNELEILETMSSRGGFCQQLFDWEGSTYRGRPFSHYADAKAKRLGIGYTNRYVADCASRATNAWAKTLFPKEASPIPVVGAE